MNSSLNKTLMALLLTLKDLEVPLREEEKSALADVGAQLYMDPDAWESDIEPSLLKMIQANPTVERLYQTAKSQLDGVDGNIPLNLLPTEAELKQALPPSCEEVSRGFDPEGDPSDSDNREIFNMVLPVISTSQPVETAQKLTSLDKLKQFLQQSAPKSK